MENSKLPNENAKPIYDIQGFEDPDNGYVYCMYNEANAAGESLDNAVAFTASLAAVSRGKTKVSNPAGLFKMLAKESSSLTPTRPYEFVPVVLYYNILQDGIASVSSDGTRDSINVRYLDFHNGVLRHSHVEKIKNNVNLGYDYIAYTNLRAVSSSKLFTDEFIENSFKCEKNKDIINYEFCAFRMKVPMFVFNHLVTHTMISKSAKSDRVTEQYNGYWLPEDLYNKIRDHKDEDHLYSTIEDMSDRLIAVVNAIRNYSDHNSITSWISSIIKLDNVTHDDMVSALLELTQEEVQEFFKILGYPREIYQRAMLEFRYKECVLVGWLNDPKTFYNLFIERGAIPSGFENDPDYKKNWTQDATRKAVSKMHEVLVNDAGKNKFGKLEFKSFSI